MEDENSPLLQEKELLACYAACHLCPRECGINRNRGQIGRCQTDSRILAARAALHMWEEPCLSGEEGSGTVFFSGCSLGCVFCQNHVISTGKVGKEISIHRLAEIFLEQQGRGANNLNLVTPTHFLPSVILALQEARSQGMNLPVVYNTSGYEKVEMLRLLDGLVDVYLPDFKYMNSELAAKYSGAEDYPLRAQAALQEMVRQVGEPKEDDKGHMVRGVIVRHLLLPGHLADSKAVIRYLYETYGNRIVISIMNQYTPMPGLDAFPELMRRVTQREYDRLVDYAINLGVENAFIQEGETAKESFIPSFRIEGI